MSFDATLSGPMETHLAQQVGRSHGAGRMNAMFNTSGNIEASGPMGTMLARGVGMMDERSMEYHMKSRSPLEINMDAMSNMRGDSMTPGFKGGFGSSLSMTSGNGSMFDSIWNSSPEVGGPIPGISAPMFGSNRSSIHASSHNMSFDPLRSPMSVHANVGPHAALGPNIPTISDATNKHSLMPGRPDERNGQPQGYQHSASTGGTPIPINFGSSGSQGHVGESNVTIPLVLPQSGQTVVNNTTVIQKDSKDNEDAVTAAEEAEGMEQDIKELKDGEAIILKGSTAFEPGSLRPTLVPSSVEDLDHKRDQVLSLEDQLANKLRRISSDGLADLAEEALSQRNNAPNIKAFLLHNTKYNLIGKEVKRRILEDVQPHLETA